MNSPTSIRVPLPQLPRPLLLHKLVGLPQRLHDLVDAVRVVALLEVRPDLIAQGFQRLDDGRSEGRATGKEIEKPSNTALADLQGDLFIQY